MIVYRLVPPFIWQASSINLGTLNPRRIPIKPVQGLNSITGTNATTNNNIITSVNPATLTIAGSGTYVYGDGSNGNSGIITVAISLVKTEAGTQTLGDANTYTGSTTITNGELRFNPSVNTVLAGACVMNGGISRYNRNC
jgi:autotransporter-associated beta strand protein